MVWKRNRSRISMVESRERDVPLMRLKVPKIPEDRMDIKLMEVKPLAGP